MIVDSSGHIAPVSAHDHGRGSAGWCGRAGDRDRGARRPREVGAGPGADRDGARPVGRGAAPRADHRPRLRLDQAARRGARGVRRRARPRALRAEHAGRRRPGARGAVRGGGRRRLDAAVGRAPGRRRRARHQARPARGHPERPGRSRPGDARRRSTVSRGPAWAPCRRSRSARSPGPACRTCGTRWNGSWRRCPSPTRPPRSGSGSTGRSASGAAAPSSPARCRPGRSRPARNCCSPRRCGPSRIRGLESHRTSRSTSAAGVARVVALNLRGVPAGFPARGMALVEAGRWTLTRLLDVRLTPRVRDPGMTLPPEMTLHIGSARTQARIRAPWPRLGSAPVARLTLRDPLPLHVGDRVLLRDPGSAAVTILGATVLDVAPPALARRGAAAAAGRELAAWPDPPSAADLLRRHGFLRAGALAAMGVAGGPPPVAGDWLADPDHWASLRGRLAEVVAAHARRDPLAIGMPPEAARAALGLPDRTLVEALALGIRGRVRARGRLPADRSRVAGGPGPSRPGTGAPSLPPRTRRRGAGRPGRPRGRARSWPRRRSGCGNWGSTPRAIAAAARAGLLLRVAEQIVLAPDAQAQAAPVPGRAAAAVHHRRGQAGARHHPAGRDPAAGIPGPGRGHRAPARRPAPPAVSACSVLVHPRAVRVSSRKPTAGRKAR